MSQPLLTGGFEWVQATELAAAAQHVREDSPQGFILEVDLEYPEELHNTQRLSVSTRALGGPEGVDV